MQNDKATTPPTPVSGSNARHQEYTRLLEEVLIEYVERYGLTESARMALAVAQDPDTPEGTDKQQAG